MAAYVIGEAEITNPEGMKNYGPLIAHAIEKFGGKYLARGAKPEVLEGGPAHKILIIEFPSMDVAKAWYASPEYAVAKAVRGRNSDLRLIAVEDFVKDPHAKQ